MRKFYAQPAGAPGIGADRIPVNEVGESIIDYLAVPSPPPGGPKGPSEPGSAALLEPHAEI